jgi:hypothetical protein
MEVLSVYSNKTDEFARRWQPKNRGKPQNIAQSCASSRATVGARLQVEDSLGGVKYGIF